jgi:hypothetical protein
LAQNYPTLGKAENIGRIISLCFLCTLLSTSIQITPKRDIFQKEHFVCLNQKSQKIMIPLEVGMKTSVEVRNIFKNLTYKNNAKMDQ